MYSYKELAIFLSALSFCSTLASATFKVESAGLPVIPASPYGQINSPNIAFNLPDSSEATAQWVTNKTSAFNPKKVPNTGKTVKYHFTIARGIGSPDGFQKPMMLINSQFPGPLIEANWGDWIEVTVHNNITGPVEGTSLHWHGLLQKETPWMDGIPSVTQCPIAPDSTFTYRFRASSFGSSWYHSHYSAQYADGLLGPMIIHGPSQLPYDIDLGPVILSDWYHDNYRDLIEGVESLDETKWGPGSQGNLVNGIGQYDCSLVTDGTPCKKVPYAKFKFTAGKTHRLRLLNSGAEGFEYFSIDGHVMTVIANDFIPVVPYNTTVVTLGIGQRTDVLVHAHGSSTDSFWMRANMSAICSRTDNPNVPAAIYYDDADSTKDPQSEAWDFVDHGRCNNDPLEMTVPYFPTTPPKHPAVTQTLNIAKTVNATGHQEWQVNGRAFRGNYNHPILLLAHEKNYTYPGDPQWNVYNFGKNSSVRLVINNDSPDETLLSHPMHLHGHDFWVVAEGEGRWDGKTIVNPKNPLRRDTVMLRRAGYVVIEFETDNPGIWPFHCHIAFHVSEGLYINVMEQPEKIKQMEIPRVMKKTCDAWNEYSSNNIVDQIDSGLKHRQFRQW
ncbi:hypothetical protein V492_02594 [Pseudogymnoascus sp. VKM F-4246]|nr:hypothetical protein V492_02594 [Pseudogymnoascus sp. VKM F-4246]